MINDLKLCVMYVRVSSDDQRDGFSIPAQIELLVDYARAHDMHIVRVFEESMSAKASGRIEFNRMLKYLYSWKRLTDCIETLRIMLLLTIVNMKST